MKLTMGEVAAYLGASCGVTDRPVEGYSIDSRSLAPGQLFFAIRGPRFDGHQFVGQALDRGAAGVVVEEAFYARAPVEWRPALLAVADTRSALQTLAREVRRKWGKRLLAVTGSTGKSTTKEMIAAILSRRFRVLRSPGNLNNDYGLPLALLGLEPEHEVAVMELAMSAAGEIARLARLAEPEVGVVTNVAAAHLQFFDSVDAIALAKRELIDYLATTGPGAVAVLNEDDERVRKFAEGFPGRVLTFGFSERAAFRAKGGQWANGRYSSVKVKAPDWMSEFTVPLPGRHNVENVLAAIAASSALRTFPPRRCARRWRNFKIYTSGVKFLHSRVRSRSSMIAITRTPSPWSACLRRLPLGRGRAAALWWRGRCWSWDLRRRSCTETWAASARIAAWRG